MCNNRLSLYVIYVKSYSVIEILVSVCNVCSSVK